VPFSGRANSTGMIRAEPAPGLYCVLLAIEIALTLTYM
jgi:hypothetical protein